MLSVSVLVTAVWATALVAADSGCDVFYSCTPKKQCEPYQEDLSTLKGKAEIIILKPCSNLATAARSAQGQQRVQGAGGEAEESGLQ